MGFELPEDEPDTAPFKPPRERRVISVLVIVLGLLAINWLVKAKRPPLVEPEIGQLKVGELIRKFGLVVPRPYDETKDYPLVYAFHGMRGDERSMTRAQVLGTMAGQRKFLLVAPRCLSTNEPQREADFFDALLTHLDRDHSFDSRRVYLVAMSKGCERAIEVAARYPERVAALVLHSGFLPPQPPADKPGVRRHPVLILVGADESTPFRDAAQKMKKHFEEREHPVQFIVVPDSGHRWATDHNDRVWEFLQEEQSSWAGP